MFVSVAIYYLLMKAVFFYSLVRAQVKYDLLKDGDVVAELAAQVKEVLAGRGTSARDLLSKGDADILAIAKEIQVVGTESQADLVNFMKLLLARL